MSDRSGTVPPITVAVVSWNTRELLDSCLASIRPDVDAGLAEVWVVDNASADGSPELVRSQHPWARLIASDANIGFGPAVNLVAERTRSVWIAIANADVRLQPGALERLLRTGEATSRAGAVAPRLLLEDGGTQRSVHRFPTLPFTLAMNLGLPALSSRLADAMCLEGWNPERPRWVDWALGAFLLVRRTAWNEIGGFDPGQWMYAEDLDLGWRLARAGWRTRYEPAARITHASEAATRQAWGDEKLERKWVSTYTWMRQRRGRIRTSAIAAINTVGVTVRWAALTIRARRDPEQYGVRRDWMRRWASIHRRGLRPERMRPETG